MLVTLKNNLCIYSKFESRLLKKFAIKAAVLARQLVVLIDTATAAVTTSSRLIKQQPHSTQRQACSYIRPTQATDRETLVADDDRVFALFSQSCASSFQLSRANAERDPLLSNSVLEPKTQRIAHEVRGL